MDLKKTLDHLPMSSGTSKPDPVPCERCGNDRDHMQVDVPMVGKRWVLLACDCKIKEINTFNEKRHQDEKKRKIRRLLRLSSSMDQLTDFTFDNYKIRQGSEIVYEQVKHAVVNFHQAGKHGLLIFGESGNGKTHITSAGANELIEQGYAVIFITEKDLLSRFRESNHFDNDERFFEIMNACIDADLLVWDDFMSSQRLSKDEKDWIFQVVNGRERANKPIWYTSNLTISELENPNTGKLLDDKGRTWERIWCNNDKIYNRATNYRRIQADARLRGMDPQDIEKDVE